eukprot:CAMPEP_0185618800 /NCGR_PEP_ID=MMETSP0436-20130131/48304_1 /TAXON_ID=626734 ORGANISM="Favella taraikaensis, Strain Fe Narragansett Bay" /NCGR_SAMPLE_ID=MMETSP0436 /ASSEMBLY_ACC=CAM_ASM_000390 /LENGTH=145 /DNA_ID=CAMNT_0028257731 /DNA_START=584 /DNA_END=1021 /DNA_ORIENTATION=-
MSRAYSKVAQVSIRSEAHSFECVGQFNKAGQCVLKIVVHTVAWQHDDLDMVFEVDEDDELFGVFDEDTAPDRVVVVDASGVVELGALHFDTDLAQPLLLLLFNARNLVVLTAELTKDFNDAPLDLKFGLTGHKGGEGHAAEVAPH